MVKITNTLEDSSVLMKGVSETLKNDIKKGGTLPIIPMLLGTSGPSLIGNLLTGKGLFNAGSGNKCNCGQGMYRAGRGKGLSTAGQGTKRKSLMPAHPLTNLEIMDYFKNEPRFNGVYSRNNLPKTIKNGAYVINLDEYKNTGTHWVVLLVKSNEVIYFDSFGVEHIPKEIINRVGINENIKTNIF